MTFQPETFEEWSANPRNKDFLDHYNVDLFAARRIWDAAKVESMHAILSMIVEGSLILNQKKSPPEPEQNSQ